MRADVSSWVRRLFWQVALTNSSALKSISVSINLPNHVSSRGMDEVDSGRLLTQNLLGEAEEVVGRAMKMQLKMCIANAQYIA